jgi:uncharacterized protein DUF6883
MGWSPTVGRLLPGGPYAIGVHEKLLNYCLDPGNEVGGPKARGFELILGITAADATYLEEAIRTGIESFPVASVRRNPPHGINCVVDLPVRGLGVKRGRTIVVRTVWEIEAPGSPPRLVSAYPKP